jgi:GTP-binding protein
MSEFIDKVSINAKAGDGGNGAMSFRREAHVAEGGPDGGDGGRGGSVWIQADQNTVSLFAYKDHPHVKATSGTNGQGKKKTGKNGEDAIVLVPEGTIVSEKNGDIVADLVHHGDRVLVAEGGKAGLGNARFLSNKRRAPSFSELGEPGEELWLELELKLMADAALVGFPNAGKSTLISSVSAAKPKIADYPFTTLVPHLGVVKFEDHEFVLADIPGLIEGASEGKGLGFQFLKHIERTRVLVILLDLAPIDGTTPEEQEKKLLHELENYRPDLLERPRLIVGSKSDIATCDFNGMALSAVTRKGIDEFLGRLGSLVDEARENQESQESFVVHTPTAQGFFISREDDASYRVAGKSVERIVAMTDLSNDEALEYMHQKFVRMGLEKALKRHGVIEGDIVRVGEFEFEYSENDVI